MTTDNKACERNIPRMLINPQTRSTYFTMGEGYRQEKLSGETQMGKLIHEISMEWKKKKAEPQEIPYEETKKEQPKRLEENQQKRGDGKAAGAEEIEHLREESRVLSSSGVPWPVSILQVGTSRSIRTVHVLFI